MERAKNAAICARVQVAVGSKRPTPRVVSVSGNIDKVLGIVDAFHHCAAVHGEPDAILRRNEILQNFLRAVGMDEDCHRAGVALETGGLHLGDVWLRFGLNLATIGLGGDLRLAGAARGIVGTADASKQPASLHRSWATLTALGEFAHSSSVTIK